LALGFQYNFEKPTNQFITELIIDSEKAIRKLEPKMQNTCRHLASKRIKELSTSNATSAIQKTPRHIIMQLRKKLQNHNLTVTKADKGKKRH
jgi:hypothetical protein